MSEDGKEKTATDLINYSTEGGLSVTVNRSVVPEGLAYPKYKPYLRRDFLYSCAYCTICEGEAEAIRFTIDHYEPQTAREDLINDYSNLLYCCDDCNILKGDRSPPDSARADGYRFFRPDKDVRNEHFKITGQRVESNSNTGYFTIEYLDLNRLSLRRLREMREKLFKSVRFVSEGIAALRSLPVDQLPPAFRSRAMRMIQQANSDNQELMRSIDELLEGYARSALEDPDDTPEDPAAKRERLQRLRQMQAMYPGTWQFRKGKATTKGKKKR